MSVLQNLVFYGPKDCTHNIFDISKDFITPGGARAVPSGNMVSFYVGNCPLPLGQTVRDVR